MLNLKVEKDAMVDLALVPCPLIVIEVLYRRRHEEWIVVADNETCNETTEKGHAERGSGGGQLEASLLARSPNIRVE